MRKVIFKGKSTTGVWYTGCLDNIDPANPKIKYQEIFAPEYQSVDPKTVCQYLDFQDNNNLPVFEGDIVEYWISTGFNGEGHGGKGYFEWDQESAGYYLIRKRSGTVIDHANFSCTIIGNIHDNQEIIK